MVCTNLMRNLKDVKKPTNCWRAKSHGEKTIYFALSGSGWLGMAQAGVKKPALGGLYQGLGAGAAGCA